MKQSRRKSGVKALAKPFVLTAAAVGFPAMVAGACSIDKPEISAGGAVTPPPVPGDDRCDVEGATRECHLNLGARSGFQSCYNGTQTCTGGRWSSCGGSGEVTTRHVGIDLVPSGLPSQGSIGGQSVKMCVGGFQNGNPCTTSANCPFGTCTTYAGVCLGGGNNRKPCNIAANCPGGTCSSPGGICAGGSQNGKFCADSTQCTGGGTCALNFGIGGTPSADAGVCVSDPCNPYCRGWDQSPGAPADGGSESGIGVSGFGEINNGTLKKLLDDSCHGGSDCDNHGGGSHFACQADTYCSLKSLGGSGCCEQFGVGTTFPTTATSPYLGTVAGVDLTIGPGCSSSGGHSSYPDFPVCNRGNTTLLPTDVARSPDPGYIHVASNLPLAGQLPTSTCPASGSLPNTCRLAIPAAGLSPGQCILLNTTTDCTGGTPSGDKYLFVNPDWGVDGGVVESDMIPTPAQPNPQPGCANNWTDHASQNNPPACFTTGIGVGVYDFTYTAVCGPSTHPQWGNLTWNSTIPTSGGQSAEIVFDIRTAPLLPDGGTGVFSTYFTMAEAMNGTTYKDPEDCALSGPSGPIANCTNTDTAGVAQPGPTPPCCPKDILAQLLRPTTAVPFAGAGTAGTTLARQEVLNLRILMKTTPDGTQAPTLNSFQLSYSCLPSE